MSAPCDLRPRDALEVTAAIVALSSALGPGARAVVRMSGRDVWQLVGGCLKEPARLPAKITRGRWPVELVLPGLFSTLPGQVLAWRAPASYTGQDLIEVHTLSSPPLIELLLTELLRRGARLARPGEFTLRAFLNGKLDLTQAEAIRGVIEAGDFEALKPALAQLAGGLATPLQELRASLLHLLAEVEAGLDFAEEDLRFISTEQLMVTLDKGGATLERLLEQLRQRAVSGRPFRVVLTGRPNAGKSTLFNALCGRDVALVSPQPGTTRDYLEQRVQCDGIEVELVDTAGAVEVAAEEDILAAAQRARQEQFERAELLLQCVDPVSPLPDEAPDRPHVTVLTKCDLLPSIGDERLGIRTSARTGVGLAELKHALAENARQARRPSALAPSLTRCRHHVEAALEHVRQAHSLVKSDAAPELLALELRLALDAIGEMVGAVYTEDLLDQIFRHFCIGK